MQPYCVTCERMMSCSKTGTTVAPEHNPNHQYSGDKYTCGGCGHSVVTFGIVASGHRSDRDPDHLIKEHRPDELKPDLKLVKNS